MQSTAQFLETAKLFNTNKNDPFMWKMIAFRGYGFILIGIILQNIQHGITITEMVVAF